MASKGFVVYVEWRALWDNSQVYPGTTLNKLQFLPLFEGDAMSGVFKDRSFL
jgi:hypothetical protein